MKWLVVPVLAFAACRGSDEHVAPDAATDAAIDGIPDPFEGLFDEATDFPRTDCRPGALAGFARTNVYTTIGLRTDTVGGALRTFLSVYNGEIQVPHILTADDLIIRQTTFDPNVRWSLRAMDICDVETDGTLHGWSVDCWDPMACYPRSLAAAPTHRIPGESEGSGLSLVGELALDATAMNVRVAGDVAYVAVGLGGLRTVSLANPAAPSLVGSYVPAANYFNDVKILDAGGRRYAVMAGSPSEVIDVTNPATPSLVATITAGAHTLFVEGTMVYLVDGGSPNLYIYDLSDPRAPIHRATFNLPGPWGGFHDLYVSGAVAYVSTIWHGLTVVDCRVPTTPVLVDATEMDPARRYWHSPWLTQVGARLVLLNGDEGGGSGMRLLDGDAASPTFLDTLGEWHLRDEISIHNVMARGATVYLSHYQDGIRVLDISNPAMPMQIGYFNTWREEQATAFGLSGAIGLDFDAASRQIYVADATRGLLVLEGTSALFP